MDSDLQHPPEVVPEMLRTAQSTAADLVVGSRYTGGGDAGGLGGIDRGTWPRADPARSSAPSSPGACAESPTR